LVLLLVPVIPNWFAPVSMFLLSNSLFLFLVYILFFAPTFFCFVFVYLFFLKHPQ